MNPPPKSQSQRPRSVAAPVPPLGENPPVAGVCLGWVPYEVDPPIRADFPYRPDHPVQLDEDWRATYHAEIEEIREGLLKRAKRIMQAWPTCEITQKKLALFVAKSHAADELSAWLICDHCNERRIKKRLWSRESRNQRPHEPNS